MLDTRDEIRAWKKTNDELFGELYKVIENAQRDVNYNSEEYIKILGNAERNLEGGGIDGSLYYSTRWGILESLKLRISELIDKTPK